MRKGRGSKQVYRWEAKSLEGFIQQLAVGYVARGYFFYVTGQVPSRMSAEEHDRRILDKFEVARSKWSRYRRKLRSRSEGRQLANVQYLRYRDFWVLLATAGEHRFFAEHGAWKEKSSRVERQYRDCRERPIIFGGYSVSWRGRTSVRISPEAYWELKTHFLRLAATEPKESLQREFRQAPFEPYGGVTQQMFAIFRAVNRVRRTAGLPLVPGGSIRMRRQPLKPFEDAGYVDRRSESSLRLAA